MIVERSEWTDVRTALVDGRNSAKQWGFSPFFRHNAPSQICGGPDDYPLSINHYYIIAIILSSTICTYYCTLSSY